MPVGSIVYLQEGTAPIVIIGVAQLVNASETGTLTYFDYSGSVYPQGATEGNVFYFNQENISMTLFKGYENEQHTRYLQAIGEWKENNADNFDVGKVEKAHE